MKSTSFLWLAGDQGSYAEDCFIILKLREIINGNNYAQ